RLETSQREGRLKHRECASAFQGGSPADNLSPDGRVQQGMRRFVRIFTGMASLAAISTAVHAEPGPAPQSADEAMEITVEGKRIRPEQGISRVEVYDQQDIERSDAFTAEEL